MRYVKHYGTWGYILHRLTGLALTGYILIHIYLVSGLHNRPAWQSEMEIFRKQKIFVFSNGVKEVVFMGYSHVPLFRKLPLKNFIDLRP